MNSKEIRKWAIWLMALLTLGTLFLSIKTLSDESKDLSVNTLMNIDSLKFDAEEWKRKRDYVEDIRPYMVGDLIKNVLVKEMDTTEVINLLGNRMGFGNSLTHYYKLGVYREIESSYLVVSFDRNGKLTKTEIIDM